MEVSEMTIIKVKEWKYDEIENAAQSYNYEVEVSDNTYTYYGERYHELEMIEVIKETEKAVNVVLRASGYKGNDMTWRTWIPKSALWTEEDEAERLKDEAENAENNVDRYAEIDAEIESVECVNDIKDQVKRLQTMIYQSYKELGQKALHEMAKYLKLLYDGKEITGKQRDELMAYNLHCEKLCCNMH